MTKGGKLYTHTPRINQVKLSSYFHPFDHLCHELYVSIISQFSFFPVMIFSSFPRPIRPCRDDKDRSIRYRATFYSFVHASTSSSDFTLFL